MRSSRGRGDRRLIRATRAATANRISPQQAASVGQPRPRRQGAAAPTGDPDAAVMDGPIHRRAGTSQAIRGVAAAASRGRPAAGACLHPACPGVANVFPRDVRARAPMLRRGSGSLRLPRRQPLPEVTQVPGLPSLRQSASRTGPTPAAEAADIIDRSLYTTIWADCRLTIDELPRFFFFFSLVAAPWNACDVWQPAG